MMVPLGIENLSSKLLKSSMPETHEKLSKESFTCVENVSPSTEAVSKVITFVTCGHLFYVSIPVFL